MQGVHIPVLDGYDTIFEVWTSSNPVTFCGQGNIKAVTDGNVLFSSLQMEQLEGLR